MNYCSPPPPPGDALAGLKLVLVDDEKDAAFFLSLILQRFGAEVTTAHSARAGFELVQKLRPDLLISDIGMPEADGYQLLSWIRGLPEENPAREVPAVAVTAFCQPQDRVRAYSVGFDEFLVKPIEPLEFIGVVAKLGQQTRV